MTEEERAAEAKLQAALDKYGITVDAIGPQFAAWARERNESDRIMAKGAFQQAWAEGRITQAGRDAAFEKIDAYHDARAAAGDGKEQG